MHCAGPLDYYTTLGQLLNEALSKRGERFHDIKARTISRTKLNKLFNNSGGAEFISFIAWTDNHVYFPGSSLGMVYVQSVPRNPPQEVTFMKQ